MSEELEISSGTKAERYEQLLPQIEALTAGETNLTANLANISAALNDTFNFWWTGFYIADQDTLVLGPFQGPVACTRIAKGKGVCGSAWQEKVTQLVPNVHEFTGHIACSSSTNSEIVVPIILEDGTVWGVLDVDSEHFDHFDSIDQQHLQALCQFIANQVKNWN